MKSRFFLSTFDAWFHTPSNFQDPGSWIKQDFLFHVMVLLLQRLMNFPVSFFFFFRRFFWVASFFWEIVMFHVTKKVRIYILMMEGPQAGDPYKLDYFWWSHGAPISGGLLAPNFSPIFWSHGHRGPIAPYTYTDRLANLDPWDCTCRALPLKTNWTTAGRSTSKKKHLFFEGYIYIRYISIFN